MVSKKKFFFLLRAFFVCLLSVAKPYGWQTATPTTRQDDHLGLMEPASDMSYLYCTEHALDSLILQVYLRNDKFNILPQDNQVPIQFVNLFP